MGRGCAWMYIYQNLNVYPNAIDTVDGVQSF